jgi:putative ABC transport system substrate-binding protein
MRRRDLIRFAGGAAAWPLAARAQPALPVIGFLGPSSPRLFAERLRPFQEGLAEMGYREGQNVTIEYRWAGGDMNRLPPFAAELARKPVTILIGAGLSATLAAKAATTTIPIVFFIGEDPIRLGLVASLNQPGGNITGVTTSNTEVGPKRLQLIRELVPSARVVGLLVNPKSPNADDLVMDMQAAARTLDLTLLVLYSGSDSDFEPAFARLAENQASALVITTDAFFISRIAELARLTLRHAVPAVFQYRDFVAAGGLMSYGGSFTDAYRQVGVYAGRILKGEKPADLPVQQASKVELFLNLDTARRRGLSVPLSLLGRADEVIE